jgi:alkaline phosphatase
VLEKSNQVLAVFQGHSHQNDYRAINGVHYTTLVAMVEGSGAENNGYSILSLEPNGTIRVSGYRNQQDYDWMRANG